VHWQVECGESREETLTRRLAALSLPLSPFSFTSLALARLARPNDTDNDVGKLCLIDYRDRSDIQTVHTVRISPYSRPAIAADDCCR
jgi:hypothetical protein